MTQATIDRVMQTYAMMVDLTPKEEEVTRQRLERSIWPEWTLTKRGLRLRGFAICADQTVLRGEEWQGKRRDGQSD